jgi:hypothetical protein
MDNEGGHCVLRMKGPNLHEVWASSSEDSDGSCSDDEELEHRGELRRVGRHMMWKEHFLAKQKTERPRIDTVNLERDLDGDIALELVSTSFEEFLVRLYFLELQQLYANDDSMLPDHLIMYLAYVDSHDI